MIYEIVPTNSDQFNFTHCFTIDNCIRYGIIFFYCLDYLHLYGDMDSVIKDVKDKNLAYFLVDFVSSILFLASFVAIKAQAYQVTICIFGFLPTLFLFYKYKN